MDDDDPLVDWNDKGDVTDWFTFDFDLAELKSLRKRQVHSIIVHRNALQWTEVHFIAL